MRHYQEMPQARGVSKACETGAIMVRLVGGPLSSRVLPEGTAKFRGRRSRVVDGAFRHYSLTLRAWQCRHCRGTVSSFALGKDGPYGASSIANARTALQRRVLFAGAKADNYVFSVGTYKHNSLVRVIKSR